MNKFTLFLFLSFYVTILTAQDALKTTAPQPLSQKEQELLLSFPDLIMPESYKNKSIPYMVDNSQTEHFRPMFVQSGMSCGQASSTGVCFTYEMNAARGLPANTNANLYPTGFVYNWDAGDWGGNGVSYYHTLEVLRTVGTPNQAEYGGTIDAGGNYRWMTGYDLYYSAMHNRISGSYKIDVGDSDGLLILKHWINDHLNGDDDGGCAVFYSTVPYPDASLPAGTEEGGKRVITSLTASTAHAMTILGFNDSIRYDYNGDGQYTNHIDINGDGQVTMADWEIGGIKMCNTYSGGPAWADGGFCYIMYKALATGAFWHDLVYVMDVNPTYEPQLTAKVNITYSNRKRIKVYAGISLNTSSTYPEYVLDLPIMDYQGGDRFMTGGTIESDKTIEFGLDLTPLLNYITPGQEAKYFIQVYENDADGWGSGTLNSFSLINYTSGTPVETVCSTPAQTIPQNGIATLSIVSSETYDPVTITTTSLPDGAIMSPYSQQLLASGGTEPYTWSFDMDFNITESIETFPTGGTTLSGSGFLAVPLGFTFNYYGVDYTTIYVSNKGLVVFESGFSDYLPYYNSHDETVFMHTKCIAPFYRAVLTSTMKTISGAGYKTIIWDNATIDYSMTLYNDGRIVFCYNNSVLTSLVPYVCGVSNGDEVNFHRIAFDNPASVANGFKYTMVPYAIPEEFEISPDGLLTGIPTQEYLSEDFSFKVVDNNGIYDKITLPFVTDGLILEYTVNTPDDDVIEYAEIVTLDLTVTNPMSVTITGISILASETDPYITITDNSAVCPDLNSSGSQILVNAFTFTVSSDIPDNHEFQMNFTVTSDQGTWDYFVLFTAFAPNIVVNDIEIDDANDNILAPDETANIIIPVLNTGGSDVHNLTVTASTIDPYITINTDTDNISALEPEQIESVIFNLSTASIIENQHTAVISLNFSGDNGYSETVEVEIVINTAVLTVLNTFVDDGDNNILDPGETSDVIFNLKNIGLVAANNLTATLTTDDPLITVNTAPIDIASLLAGNNTLLTYNISVDPSCDMAHFVELNMHVDADNGLSTDITCYLIIGILSETFESGGLEAFEWVQPEAIDWYIVSDEVYDGAYSLRSGNIGHNQQTVLEIEMFVVADGNISFARKVSSENYYDFFEFLIDDFVVLSLSGEMPWEEYSHPVTTGQHTFQWRYRKDVDGISGQDAAWIDNIVFPAVNNIPSLLSCEVVEIAKLMNTNQTDADPLIISNVGGGILDFEVDVVPVEYKSKDISGSTLSADIITFAPGETYTVTFVLNALSPDYEWIKNLVINFPPEITVNSSTDLVGPSGTLFSAGTTGAGTSLAFTTTETWGVILENETATCTVNLTFDEDFVASESSIGYVITGDNYGSDPHSVSSEIVLTNLHLFWLHVSPNEGSISYSSDFELSLNYSTEGMAEGVYYANLIVSAGEDMLTIPVELTVDFSAGLEVISVAELSVWPNPFNSSTKLSFESAVTGLAELHLYDITGKQISLPLSTIETIKGTNVVEIDFSNWLPAGMYILRVNSGNKHEFVKLIKQ
jgi:hypothetical protein